MNRVESWSPLKPRAGRLVTRKRGFRPWAVTSLADHPARPAPAPGCLIHKLAELSDRVATTKAPARLRRRQHRPQVRHQRAVFTQAQAIINLRLAFAPSQDRFPALCDKLRNLNLAGGKPVGIWVADEHRYGLIPVVRKRWTLRGSAPRHRTRRSMNGATCIRPWRWTERTKRFS